MENTNNNYKLIERLNNLGFLTGPSVCSCGNKKFKVQKLLYNKTNKLCFRCSIKQCKKRYLVNVNSFFEDYKKISIKDCLEIIKSNLCLNFNKKKIFKSREKYKCIRKYNIKNIQKNQRDNLLLLYYSISNRRFWNTR